MKRSQPAAITFTHEDVEVMRLAALDVVRRDRGGSAGTTFVAAIGLPPGPPTGGIAFLHVIPQRGGAALFVHKIDE